MTTNIIPIQNHSCDCGNRRCVQIQDPAYNEQNKGYIQLSKGVADRSMKTEKNIPGTEAQSLDDGDISM